MKIFRDLIYQMRGMMRADHKFFKSHGQYDFPQKKCSTSMKMYLVGWMMNNKKVRSRLGNKINEGMVAPYADLLKDDKQIRLFVSSGFFHHILSFSPILPKSAVTATQRRENRAHFRSPSPPETH